MHETQSWFAGVDWASQKHDVWLADASGKRLGKPAEGAIAHTLFSMGPSNADVRFLIHLRFFQKTS